MSAALDWSAAAEAGSQPVNRFFDEIIGPLIQHVDADLSLVTGLHAQAVITKAIRAEANVRLSAGLDEWDQFCTLLVGLASLGTAQDPRGIFVQYTIEHIRNRLVVEAGLDRKAAEQARLYSLAERLSRIYE